MLKTEPYYAPNRTVEIPCDVAAYPTPNITWTFLKCPYYPSFEDADNIELQVRNNFYKFFYLQDLNLNPTVVESSS